ncbi:MAG: arylsulfatase [Bacteroides helcogenes]|uniref:Sulfatase n=2 Tax=Bacteroides helcogenes TaxID=290053 RepID=E6SR72_BACT6|nr:arylsulfatase [Bacteroides helcogenes]ADV42076.1 sulfatase [Bacteroides helcogenes P 36-108]MDY5240023.1 arylsulfatase [Bacteroides helcogenes]
MNRQMNIGLCSLALMSCAVSVQASAKGKVKNKQVDTRPNVIFIYADDLGYGDLQCYGAKNVETPHINQLAQQGIRFTNAYATAATSTPSRYSMLTGEYAWRRPDTDVAAGDAGMIVRPEQFTIADVFKSAGYATAALGKWHLGLGDKTGQQDWNAPLSAALGDLGFDYSYIMAATADRVPCVFIENGKVANYDPSAPIEVSYVRNFPGEPTGKNNPELLYNLKPSHGHDQAIVNGISRIGFMKGGGKALWKDENIADSITVHAIDFIKKHNDEPFFMYFATNDVHVPRFPHDRFRGKNPMGLRGDAIVQFDWSVGQILDVLEKMGLRENTLIVLSSDNGPVVDDGYQDKAEELLNGHSPAGHLRGGKYSAYEGGTRVPVIVSWPKRIKEEGRESDVVLSQIDWLASMAALSGIQLPKNSAPDSFNRLGNLLGEDDTDRPWVIEQSQNKTLSVRTKDWKYIEPSDGPKMIQWGPKIETGYRPEPQLFDMKQGLEEENVAAKYPEKTFELQQILRKVRNKSITLTPTTHAHGK